MNFHYFKTLFLLKIRGLSGLSVAAVIGLCDNKKPPRKTDKAA